MKIHTAPQGSDEWLQARAAIPTASNFSRIVTPKTGKLSEQRFGYAYELVAEWFLGGPIDNPRSEFMQRGTDMEAEAVRWYEFRADVEAQSVGLCLLDDGSVGGSPDRLIGDDGGLEIKVPNAANQIRYVMRPDDLELEYRPQVQGLLWITGRAWFDLVAYSPSLPKVLRRIEPDPAYVAMLQTGVAEVLELVAEAKVALAPAKAERDEAMIDNEIPPELVV